MKFFLILVSLISISCLNSFSQPIITGKGINPVLNDYFIAYGIPYFNPGASGANANWNINGTVTVQDTFVYVLPNQTFYASSFPNANIAYEQIGTTYSYYYMIDSFKQQYWGGYGAGGGSPYYYSKSSTLKLPISYLTSYLDTSICTNSNNIVFNTTTTYSTSEVDGYGTLTTPIGTFNNVIRVHSISHDTISSFNTSNNSMNYSGYISDGYAWFANGYHGALANCAKRIDVATNSVIGSYGDYFKYGYGSIGVNEVMGIKNIALQPNPTNTSTTLTFNNELSSATIEVMNITGQTIFKKENVAGKQTQIDLSNQAAGIYFIEVKQAAEVWRGKVVKE